MRYEYNNIHKQGRESAKEARIVAIARSGQDIVSNDVTNRTPSKNIDDVESNRVVRFQEANVFLGTIISGFEVGFAVLLRNLFGHILSLEVEEDEPTKEEGETSAEAYNDGWAELGSHDGGGRSSSGGGG